MKVGDRYVSFDGDADRIVYFFIDKGKQAEFIFWGNLYFQKFKSDLWLVLWEQYDWKICGY